MDFVPPHLPDAAPALTMRLSSTIEWLTSSTPRGEIVTPRVIERVRTGILVVASVCTYRSRGCAVTSCCPRGCQTPSQSPAILLMRSILAIVVVVAGFIGDYLLSMQCRLIYSLCHLRRPLPRYLVGFVSTDCLEVGSPLDALITL